jgi:16S rRNA (uracil1498-N3)-methyltransferase
MTYFLAPSELTEGASLLLEGDEAQHLLRSRRMRAGERFALQDPRGQRFWAEVVQPERRGARIQVHGPAPVPAPPAVPVRLWIAGIKDKAFELVVQKATELGVAEVHAFTAQHSTVAHAELASRHALERWGRIALEACKQCDRQFPPVLQAWGSLNELLLVYPHPTRGWLLDREGGSPLQAPGPKSAGVTVLVGPEGGLTPEETLAALQAGFTRVSLGSLTLRAETAALAGCAVAVQAGPTPV